MFIAYGTVLPIAPGAERHHWQSGPYSIPDIVQNFLLFLPFGALGVLTLRQPHSVAWRIVAIAGIAGAFSAAIETAQLYSLDRTASIADVTADTAGAIAGAVAVRPFAAAFELALNWVRWPMAALALVSWFPFDVTLDVSTTSARIRPLLRDPLQAGTSSELLWQLFAFALAAFIMAVHPRTRMRSVLVATLATLIVIDLGRPLMGARVIGLAGATAQMVGGVLGAALGSLVL